MRATEHRAGGRGRSGRAVPLLAAVLVAVTGSATAPARAQLEASLTRYTRSLDVPVAGWFRVPLDPDVLRRIEAGGGFRLFGPEGELVTFRRQAEDAPPRRRPAETGRAVPAETGWWIPLKVAPGARPHDRLLFDLDVTAWDGEVPPTVRLEGSDDGESWRLLVLGRPAAEGEGLALPYPATEVVRLRLGWPRDPGFAGAPPNLVAAAVEEVPRRSYRLSVARPDCRTPEPSPASPRTVCRLAVGGSGRHPRRLCMAVTAPDPTGYRLLDAEAGRWETVAEGVWSGAGEGVPRCLPLDLTLGGEADTLRLELYAGGEEAPGVRDARVELAPEVLVVRAARAGLHTLAYGPAVFRSSREGELSMPPGAEWIAVEPGPEEATDVPASTLALAATAPPAPAADFARTWEVAAEAPEPGQLYRLTLPPDLYTVTRDDLADVRLLALDHPSRRQVPYARWRPDEPVAAAELRGATPRPASQGGGARIELRVAEPDLPLSALVVSAAPGVEGSDELRRRLRVRSGGGEGAGDGAVGPWVDWRCRPRPPLPCRATVVLDAPRSRRLTVELEAAGEPGATLPRPHLDRELDLELWRRRDVLLFPWPGEGSALVLAAGAPDLEPPAYELADRLPELLARPWREATLAAEGARGAGGRLGSVAIAAALLAAAAALLLLLHRILADQAVR